MTATGVIGKLLHAPSVMFPFCGYNMGDYFAHWLKMGEVKQKKCPAFFTSAGSAKIIRENFYGLVSETIAAFFEMDL
jgi:hypothetical protein